MNNRGQVLVLFLMVLPIILLLFGFLIETAYLSYKKVLLTSLTKTIITNSIEEKNKDDIIMLYKDNKVEIEEINITFDKGIKINLTSKIKSLVGSILKKNSYLINIDIYGFKENGKIIFEKG